MVAQPAAAKPPDPGSSELSPLASPGEVAIQSSFRGNNWAPGRSAEAAAWVTAPAPAPRALPFGLIRRRCRKEGVNTFCVPGRLLAAPGISPVLFCLWTFVQTAPPHAESPPTRLYPSRSFPSVSLLRPHTLTEPSRPAQDGLCAFNAETLSSDPFFHPDVAPGVRLSVVTGPHIWSSLPTGAGGSFRVGSSRECGEHRGLLDCQIRVVNAPHLAGGCLVLRKSQPTQGPGVGAAGWGEACGLRPRPLPVTAASRIEPPRGAPRTEPRGEGDEPVTRIHHLGSEKKVRKVPGVSCGKRPLTP